MSLLILASLLAAPAPSAAPAYTIKMPLDGRVVTVQLTPEPVVCATHSHWYAPDHAPTKPGAQRPGDVDPETLDVENAFGTRPCAPPPPAEKPVTPPPAA